MNKIENKTESETKGKITKADIAEQIRLLLGKRTPKDFARNSLRLIFAGFGLIGSVAYMLGKIKGRRSQTFVEIRRL